MKKMDKLTNLDISNKYRGEDFWFMRSDFLGAFAYWVVVQSPYDTPDISESLVAFNKYISSHIETGVPRKFTYEELEEFINCKVLEAIPEVEKLNHPLMDTGRSIIFVSRCNQPAPDYDFIDLEALAHNIFYMLLRKSITTGG